MSLSLKDFIKYFGYSKRSNLADEVKAKLLKGTTVITHNGVFHADELTAIAIIRYYSRYLNSHGYKPKPFDIKRTRDINYSDKEKNIIVDVGDGVFDHHSSITYASRGDKTKYASAGLVWAILGPEMFECKDVHDVDLKLIKSVDQADTGGSVKCILNDIVTAFKPIYKENVIYNFKKEEYDNKCFDDALRVFESFIFAFLDKYVIKEKTAIYVDEARQLIATKIMDSISKNRPYIIVDEEIPFASSTILNVQEFILKGDRYKLTHSQLDFARTQFKLRGFSDDDLYFLLKKKIDNINEFLPLCIMKNSSNTYNVMITKLSNNPSDIGTIKCSFPKSLCGLKGFALENAAKEMKLKYSSDITFVHDSGFMAVTKSLDSAKELCDITYKELITH